ncbi:MAG TPA: multidrug effflux MFS transporter [Methylibium sp.]|uniref:multidrug effflux MFS transporter n=1 Tax=Methylibium sp. TaxID=2067992 RepID=UPI002DC026B8|nr:multidrug effflux MFS transporter [Methylibium sp.]HEU4460265.1 multidrug effflux MFS transporter [Methylibium sp.]
MAVVEQPSATPIAAPARERVQGRTAIVALTLLLGLQPVSTDLYLPALPALRAALGASAGQAQFSLSALLLAFGFAQLVAGPLADRYGRRPLLLGGLSLYALAGFGGAVAASIEALVAWRAVQGVGLACAVVCARAMVRDLYAPRDGMTAMSRGLTGLGIVALACPLAGALVAVGLGWRATLAVLGIYAAGALGFVALRVPETAPALRLDALQPARLAAAWWRIVRHRQFRAYTALTACTYGGVFAFLAGSPFVLIEVLGRSSLDCGLVVASSSVAYVAGTVVCRRWLARFGPRGTVARGAWLSLAGGLSMAALAAADVRSIWAVVLPQLLYAVGHGQHQPCGQAGAVGAFPQEAGAAASLAGFALAVTAFAIGSYLGWRFDGTPRALAYTVGGCAVATALVAWTWVQRDGEPAQV